MRLHKMQLCSWGEYNTVYGKTSHWNNVSVKSASPKENRSAETNQRCGSKELCSRERFGRICREQSHSPALRIGHTLLFLLLPALLLPWQNTPYYLIPQFGTPSSANYNMNMWIPECTVLHTIRLAAARCSGTFPHAAPTSPDGFKRFHKLRSVKFSLIKKHFL